MKIIGKTQDGLLISATANEVANLCGYYYESAQNCPLLRPGDEIQISAVYRQLYELKRSAGRMAKTAKELRDVARLLELHDPIINEASKLAGELP